MLSAVTDLIWPFLFTPKTRVCLCRCATKMTINRNILNFPARRASATLYYISSGSFSVRIALEMEAHVPKSGGAPAGFDRLSPSHGKSEEEMQTEERRKTRIPGRPGEGAVRGVFWCSPEKLPVGVVVYSAPLSGIYMQSNKWQSYT